MKSTIGRKTKNCHRWNNSKLIGKNASIQLVNGSANQGEVSARCRGTPLIQHLVLMVGSSCSSSPLIVRFIFGATCGSYHLKAQHMIMPSLSMKEDGTNGTMKSKTVARLASIGGHYHQQKCMDRWTQFQVTMAIFKKLKETVLPSLGISLSLPVQPYMTFPPLITVSLERPWLSTSTKMTWI